MRILLSAALVPQFNVSGAIQPILGVGWTLSYEVYFYGLFALSLWIGRDRYLLVLLCLISVVWISALSFGSKDAVSRFLSNPLIFEFIFGCALGVWYPRLLRLPLTAIAAAALCIAASTLALEKGMFTTFYRPLYWGIPCAMIVAGCLSLKPLQSRRITDCFNAFGSASYNIYLIHIPIIKLSSPVLGWLVATGLMANVDAFIFMGTTASVAAGLAFYLITQKYIAWSRPLLSWRSSPVAA